MISPQLKFDIKSEIIIDNFAGSECASTGIKMPPGQHVAVANNHDQNRPPSILWMPERATHPDRHKIMASAPMHHPPQAACCAAHLEVIK